MYATATPFGVVTRSTRGGLREVWPQPDFNGSAGLFLINAAVTGGEVVFSGSVGNGALCTGLLNGADPLVVGQTWRITGFVTAIDNQVDVKLGCNQNSSGGTDGAAITATGAFSFDTLLDTVTNQYVGLTQSDGTIFNLTSLSVKRVN